MCGEMNMRLVDFYSYTPREFFAFRDGFMNIRDTDSKERLLLTRKLMWASMRPHYRQLSETDIMAFEFELQAQENAAQLDSHETEQEKQEHLDFWKRYDFMKNKKGTC